MQRLLAISCSQRKRSDPRLLPAIERYDGPSFRVLRRYLRERPTDPPEILILSAEFGLIEADRPIPVYDRRMTLDRAGELQPIVASKLVGRLQVHNRAVAEPERLLIYLSRDYLPAIFDPDDPVTTLLRQRVVPGGRGAKLSRLRDWLCGEVAEAPKHSGDKGRPVRVRLRGVEVLTTGAEVLEQARAWMLADDIAAERWQSWYVSLEGRRVAPKWLTARLMGVDVGRFTTSEARVLLAKLGIEVNRT